MKGNQSLLERIVGVLKLDVPTFEEIEHDQSATGQAALVVVLVAVLSGLGSGLSGTNGFSLGGLLLGIIGVIIGWVVWSALVYYIGTSFFGGTADIGEMLRVIGFARAPSALGILAFIPVVGLIIGLVAAVWSLVAGVIGVRQGLDISTTNAVIVVIIGWIVAVVIGFVLAAIGLGSIAIMG